jgi:hypothetical protein
MNEYYNSRKNNIRGVCKECFMNENKLFLIEAHFIMPLLIILYLLFMPFNAHAATIFVCVDKAGNEIITDSPTEGNICRPVAKSKEMTPQEKIDYEKKREDKQKNREIEYEKNKTNEEAKERLSECLQNAKKRFEDNWAGNCNLLNLPFQCNLPDDRTKRWNDMPDVERKECFERNPQKL